MCTALEKKGKRKKRKEKGGFALTVRHLNFLDVPFVCTLELISKDNNYLNRLTTIHQLRSRLTIRARARARQVNLESRRLYSRIKRYNKVNFVPGAFARKLKIQENGALFPRTDQDGHDDEREWGGKGGTLISFA